MKKIFLLIIALTWFSAISFSQTVTTNAATSVTQNSATLNGTVNGGGNSMTYIKFDYVSYADYQAIGWDGATAVNATPSDNSGHLSENLAVSASISDLDASTKYYFRVKAYYGGYYYGLRDSLTTLTPPSSSSDIISADNETSNIDYASKTGSSITATTDAIRVWSFTIRDGGGSDDADTYGTELTSVTIDKGGSNSVSNWANTIRQAALFDGTTKIAEVSVTGETFFFTGLSGANVTAADNGTKTLDLYLTFETTNITDNQQFQFQIQNANVTANSSTSTFTTFTAATSSTTSDANRIEVTATKLLFVQQPSTVNIDDTMTPDVTVEAADANNMRDLDFTTSIDITAAGATLTTSPLTSAASSGLATFSTISFTSGNASVTLNAERNTSGDWDVSSNNFEVTQPEIDVQGNSTSIADGDNTPDLADHTDFGGVDVTGTNSVTRTFTIYNQVAGGNGALNLTGTPKVAISGTNASEFTVASPPTTPIAQANYTTFQVKFDPTGAGLRTAEISIANNDADEDPYNFSIQGTGAVVPTVTTTNISSIGVTTASSGGNVTSDGGLSVTEKGVCWNTTTNPVYADNHTSDGSGTGVYTSTIPSLTAATQYYVRAYATNSSGNGYGENKSFWTLANEPTTHPSNFDTTAITETSMSFSWDAATGADGYIILQKTGSTPPTNENVDDGLEKGEFNLPTGTTVATEVVGATTGSVTNLVTNTEYSFTIIAYGRVTNDSTYNYKTDGTLQSLTETTVKGTPVTQATTITFSAVDYTSMTVSWVRGDGDNCLVLAHASAPVDADPANTNVYSANAAFGSGDQIGTGNYVVYNGSSNSVNVTNLNNGTTYYYEVFEYNNSGTDTKYLIGGGTGNPNSRSTLKTAPTTQASNITFTNVDSETLTLNWTRGDGEHCIVVAKVGSGITAPTTNTDYTANPAFGSGGQTATDNYVIYNGTGSSVDVTTLTQSTDYYFEVYECNNDNGNCQYNTSTASNNPNNQLTLKNTPVNQSSNIAFTNVAATTMTVSWDRPASDGGDYCILVAKQGSAADNPTNGTSYTANTAFGSGDQTATDSYVLYNGNDASPSVNITNLSSTQTYHFKIYEYNNNGTSYTKYNLSDATNNPNSQATTAAAPTVQSHDITFTNIDTTSISASWTNGNGAYRLVKVNTTNSFTDPSGSVGSNSVWQGSGEQVVYNGSSNTVTVTGFDSYTNYYFRVYDYNDYNFPKYNTSTATNNPNNETTLKLTPVAQDCNISFSSINATTMTVSWTRPASTGDNCILVAKEGGTTSNPVNGEDYTANASFSDGNQIGTTATYVVYKGSSNTVALTNLMANRTYHFKVCEFNNSGAGNTKYLAKDTTNNPNSQLTANAAPTTQASIITFSNVDVTTLTVDWTSGNGQNRIVKINTSNSFTDPTDGTDPTANSAWQSSGEQIVYNSNGSTVDITSLDVNTTYWFRVYEYNNSGTSTMYNVSTATDNPNSILTLKNAPTTQASNITFANLASTSVTVNWTNGNGDNRIVVAKNGTVITSPTNNTSYTANPVFGSGDITGSDCYVVYNGTGTSVDITGLSQNQTYEFRVFEFNNSGTSYAKYNTSTDTDNPKSLTTSGYSEWTGTASTSWDATGNWSSSSVPTSTTDVIIKSVTNKPVISATSSCNNLTIEPEASLTINSGYTLSVSGDLTIQATSSGLGCLIENGTGSVSVTGTTKVQNYISDTEWHYLSSPITSTTINFLTGYYANSFNEAGPSWTHLSSGAALNVMQGYSIKNSSGSQTITFNGTLNTGSKSISVTNTTPGNDSYGWNLVGNPYPSTIDWKATGWTKTNVDYTIYVFIGSSQYATFNESTNASTNGGTRYLSSMQGFFVHASATGSLGVSNDVRIDVTQAYLKKSDELPNNLLKLRVEKGDYNDEAVVLFYPNASQIFDNDFDAYKMFSGNADIPELYTSTQLGEQLAVNTLPDISNNVTIPLGFKTEQDGNYTINAVENTFDENTSVLLEDLEQNEVVDLKISDYSFNSGSVNNSDRFLLHFVLEATGVVNNIEIDNSVSIYSFKNNIYIKNNTENIIKGEVVVYNILGEEIIRKQINNTTLNKITINKVSGNYIVRVLTNNKIYSEKVFIK